VQTVPILEGLGPWEVLFETGAGSAERPQVEDGLPVIECQRQDGHSEAGVGNGGPAGTPILPEETLWSVFPGSIASAGCPSPHSNPARNLRSLSDLSDQT